MNQGHFRQLKRGDVLFEQGQSADCAYIIEQGQLRITADTEDGLVVIGQLGPGDIVGEVGFLDNTKRSATATATEPAKLTIITREQLTERVSQADPILKLLVKMLLERHGGLGFGDGPKNLLPEEIVGEYMHHGIDRIRLEAELKDALANQQLEVRYQPVMSLDTRWVAGLEALTRWPHPERGPIAADLFINLAEETNLIVPVGLYVFEQACRQLLAFDTMTAQVSEDTEPLFMSINVSARQIADPEFVTQAAELARGMGIDLTRLKLEITETMTADLDLARRFTKRCRKLGFKVAIDDFGTGYSSLSTLARLHVDTVKIDQSFVRPIKRDARSRDLLRGIVDLARNLDFETIIEGVETDHELAFVEGLGCDFAQGFLIGRSMTPSELEPTLTKPLLINGNDH